MKKCNKSSSLYRTLGQFQPNSWMKGYVSCKPLNSQKGDKGVFFSLNQHYGIIMALRKFAFIGTVSQVRDVAHGLLNLNDTAVHMLLLMQG